VLIAEEVAKREQTRVERLCRAGSLVAARSPSPSRCVQAIRIGFDAFLVTAATSSTALSGAFRRWRLAEALVATLIRPMLVVDEVGSLTCGTDAVNM
jgi:hypothetical protein